MSGQANSVLQQEMPFDTVMRQSPLGMAVIAMDGTYVAVNDAYARIYGYLPTEMQGHSFLMVFPEDQRASLLRLHQNFLMYGGTLSGEWEVLRKDGTHSHVISESACVRGQDGTDRRLVYVTDISVRRKIESELEASRIFAHAVIDGLSSQLCVLNEDGIIVSANHAWRRFYIDTGGDPEHLLKPVSYLEICMAANGSQRRGQPDTSGFPEQLRRVLRGDLQSFELEYPWHTPTERRWFIARAYRLPGVSPARIVVSHDNVTALKNAQEELHEALRFTRKLIHSMQDGFMVLDKRFRPVEVNPAMCRMTGYTESSLLYSEHPFPYLHHMQTEELNQLFHQIHEATEREIEFVIAHPEKGHFPASMTVSRIYDEDGQVMHYIAIVKDITERRRVEQEIQRLAFYDALTGLPNRRLLHDRLEHCLRGSRRHTLHGAVLMLDLDNFKPLNDHFGHDAGDCLLVEVANRLQACVRASDTVARLGGDEFVVVICELDSETGVSFELAAQIAEKMQQSLTIPYQLRLRNGETEKILQHHCSASVGVALFSAPEHHAADILKRADQAMYQAKERGRNRVCFADFPPRRSASVH